jgi:glycerate kinase
MKIVIASDSYKNSLAAAQVCAAIERGFKRIMPTAEYLLFPIADGGEGTLQAISNAKGGVYHQVEINDPLNNSITAEFLQLDDSCIIEVASACGLELLTEQQRDPLITSSYGVGQLIFAALALTPSKIIIGLGGSATNDGGVGMFAALGAKFFNQENDMFIPTGGTLSQISHIDITNIDSRLAHCEIVFASDVTAPLCGETGATYMFAAQKGAKNRDLALLEKGLLHLGTTLVEQGGIDISSYPGAGAAGGMASPLMSLFNSKVCSGIDLVLDIIDFNNALEDTTLVITGEGRVDGQTQHGKAPIGVAKRAKTYDIPVILLCGAIKQGYEAVYQHGIDAVYSATPEIIDLTTAIKQTPTNLTNLAENVARLFTLRR